MTFAQEFMPFFLMGAAIVASAACIFWMMDAGHFALLGILLALGIGGFFYVLSQKDREGPCMSYTEGRVWDPATKTSRIATWCAERGQWKDKP